MTPAIYGITGNLGNPASGSTSFTVITNNSTGFNLTVKASTTPALATGAYSFADFGNNYIWQSPAASTATFGFAVVSNDAATDFWHDETMCGVIPLYNDSEHCFRGFTGTTPITVIYRDTNTGAGGSVGTIYFQAESNAAFLAQDTYTATVTVTATVN
jgi:hypothetical protein